MHCETTALRTFIRGAPRSTWQAAELRICALSAGFFAGAARRCAS
jgi:hypothetical protein